MRLTLTENNVPSITSQNAIQHGQIVIQVHIDVQYSSFYTGILAFYKYNLENLQNFSIYFHFVTYIETVHCLDVFQWNIVSIPL